MENCEKVLNLLNEYTDGELCENDALFVRAHLENCEWCKKTYDELVNLRSFFEESQEDAPAELCERVMSKIKSEKSAFYKRKKFAKIFGGVAIAAAISLTVLASPAILMVVTGGAKAECQDMAEALTPSLDASGANGFYYSDSDMKPECEITTQSSKFDGLLDDIFDESEDCVETDENVIAVGDFLVPLGKKFTVNMKNGTYSAIAFEAEITEEYSAYAVLNGKKYEYKVDGGFLYLNNENEALVFEIIQEKSLCFIQAEVEK